MVSKNKKTITNTIAGKGFTILELLLVIFIFSFMTMGAVKIFEDWQRDTINRQVASEMRYLHNLASEYVEFNFDAVMTQFGAPPSIGAVIDITLNDLVDSGLINAGYTMQNSFRQTMRIRARYADDDSVNGDVVEVITFSDGLAIENDRLFKTATYGGPSTGVISALDINATCCSNLITSTQSTWSLPIAAIEIVPNDMPVADASGGYVAVYGRVYEDGEILSQNYLYRNEDPNFADANTMKTDLNLNNNDIVNANFIVSDNMDVANTISIANTSNNDAALSVENDMTSGTLDILQAGDTNKGLLTILGDGGIGTDFTADNIVVMVDDDPLAGGQIQADTIQVQNNLTVLGDSDFNALNMGGNDLAAENIYVENTEYGGTLNVTDSLQAGRMTGVNATTVNDNLVATSIEGVTTQVNGTMDVPAPVTFSGGANGQSVNSAVIATEKMDIADCISTPACNDDPYP